MKKISLLFLLAVVFAFAGCSDDDKEKTYVLNLPTYEAETLYMGDLDNPVKTWDLYGTTYYQTLLLDNSKFFEFDCIASKAWGLSSDAFAFTNATSGNYSAITKKGVTNNTYVVVGASGYEDVAIHFNNDDITSSKSYGNYTVKGLYVTNSQYAYNSMKNGEGFYGEDEIFGANDKFTLTIYNKDKSRKVEVALAEGTDILAEWKWVDLSSLGETEGLKFSLSSTKTNEGGMMTPAYFCLDGITVVEN